MKVALLISTYNWPEALNVVLKSVQEQSQHPDEILIADDGSGPETKSVIDNFKKVSSLPVTHFWHEDKGFRKSSVLNKTLALSNSDYIIQVDGDCILHKDFIRDHIEHAGRGVYLFGSRVNIKPESVAAVLNNKIFQFSVFSGNVKNKTRNLRIPFLRDMYKEKPHFSRKLRGCNLSFWKEDFVEVNGYNEDMEGWGREDSELVLRMLNRGVKGKRLRYGGIVYHIYHPEKSKSNLERNDQIQQITISEKLSRCENGFDKYINKTA